MSIPRKPLGIKTYGHIPHLPGSRMGPADHTCDPGQARIATERPRDRHDQVIVQEKLDGSNCGIARLDDRIYALSRAGYEAWSSPFEQHHHFAAWVMGQVPRFLDVLREGERLVGEWLMQAHGTRYALPHEPFVVFDLMVGTHRLPYDALALRLAPGDLTLPKLLHRGGPLGIEAALALLGEFGHHGALDPVEGAVWRVERNTLIDPGRGGERRREVDFIVKYVRPDKVDGCYLPELSGGQPVWNWYPERG
jgi:hypothetical protein